MVVILSPINNFSIVKKKKKKTNFSKSRFFQKNFVVIDIHFFQIDGRSTYF